MNIAHNNHMTWMEVYNNTMIDMLKKYPNFYPSHGSMVGSFAQISFDHEVLSIFLKNHNIIVKWINCNNSWGLYDAEMEQWTGAVGQVNIHSHFAFAC